MPYWSGQQSLTIAASVQNLMNANRHCATRFALSLSASDILKPDFLIVEVDDGKAVFQGTPRPEHLNPMGTVHGGWFATLLDSALGCAVHTRMEPGRGYTTAELGINLVKAITPKVQRVRAEGRVIHSGRQLATAEARLVGPDGTLYAHATTTCLVFDLPAQSKV